MNKKRSTELTKVVMYLRRKIKSKIWSLGDRISSISYISKKLNTSYQTVKKGMTILRDEGIIEDRGYYGYFLIDSPNKNINGMINNVKSQLKAAELLNSGGILDRKRSVILKSNYNKLQLYFPYTDRGIIFNMSTVIDSIYNPVTVKQLVEKPNLRLEYNKQKKVRKYHYIIIPNRQKLNIRGKYCG